MWSPQGQPVMIPTPGQPYKRDGLGAVNDHTGETVVLFRRRKRRREVAELLQAENHQRVLDVCAAPGSKTTLIVAQSPKLW